MGRYFFVEESVRLFLWNVGWCGGIVVKTVQELCCALVMIGQEELRNNVLRREREREKVKESGNKK